MFPTATAVTVVRNVARRDVFCHLCLCVQVLLSLATFSHGLSRSAVAEARRRATVCHGWFYVPPRPETFCWYLSRFVTLRSSSAMSIKLCQGTWAMNGVRTPICPRYKEEVQKAAASVILCTLDKKTSLHVMAMKKPISYLYKC